ncbi:MAG: Enoyl-CoA hydratase / carnithine racemase [Subtercola sp.]|nr:Enoyl-CoA hydratase / carnithine racemase [Subtercola sp.]
MGVSLESVGHAAVVTLRWTDRRNALGPDEAREVAEAIREAATTGAHGIVLTGEGAFCAGGDLKAFADISARMTPTEIRTHVYGDVQAIVRALRDAPMHTVAAVDGPAVGLGMDLALACDTRFIGASGWMRQGWARAGLISATGGTWFIEQQRRGSVWALIADQPKLTAELSVELGLADVSEPSALTSALARVEALSSVPLDVVAAYARLSRTGDWPDDSYFDLCADYQSEFIGSERFRTMAEGLLAAADAR